MEETDKAVGLTASEQFFIDHAERALRERDDADRRAGSAERKLEALQDSAARRAYWLRQAKQEWGAEENVSFDVIWTECLQLKRERERMREAQALLVQALPYIVGGHAETLRRAIAMALTEKGPTNQPEEGGECQTQETA